MCCLVAVILLLGPRLGILLWWLFDMPRWERAFSTFIWPLLGAIFLPWTTVAYVFVFPNGVTGLDWLWLALALLVDLGAYTGGGRESRKRFRK